MRFRSFVDRLGARKAPYNLGQQAARTWADRSETAARLFADASSGTWVTPIRVADLGCGNQRLRSALEAELGAGAVAYQGFDVRPQGPDVGELDLDRALPAGEWDVMFTLGVLEYLPDMDDLLARLAPVAPWYVLSHVIADSGAYSRADVDRMGWTRLPRADVCVSALGRAGFTIVAEATIDEDRARLWICRGNVHA